MPDQPLDMLVVRDMPDGLFAVADALQGAGVVQNGLKSRAEAVKFIEDYYLACGVIEPPAPKNVDQFWAYCLFPARPLRTGAERSMPARAGKALL
jgi:hypothetical protein